MKSIRGRIILLFVFCLLFGGALTVLHYANMYTVRHKIVLMEKFDTLLNDILETRRFEKNFIYYRDTESLRNWKTYIGRVKTFVKDQEEEITMVAGPEKFHRFKTDLNAYDSEMRQYIKMVTYGETLFPVDEIRTNGGAVVGFSQNLIKIKTHNINRDLNRMIIWPAAYFSIFVILTIIIFQMLNFTILKPLYMIRKATKQVVAETFEPIVYQTKHKNEITKLIFAFNKMASELKTRQEQLLQSRKMASIGTFTSGIAHELNNPLNNIYLTAESLLMCMESMPEPEKQALIEDIMSETDRASAVVKNLLEFSRSENPDMRMIETRNFINRTIKFVKNQLLVKGIVLATEIADNLPDIKGKQQQLETAFLNIIINAIQAMETGGRITIRAALALNDHIRIDISDTGVGIDPSDMAHIFDPFYTTKEVGKGTGLGLSLVYGIIQTHGGYIEVNSKVNKGTTFSIFLPATGRDEENIEIDGPKTT
ncbi:MAG: HAMP domain-containing histidine kinase [Deltaproteobacteria bacterium]|nr:HAMP domain-containing histidine kinase [Deltaproteobacteria bacterium]